jgi:hypothetical protein
MKSSLRLVVTGLMAQHRRLGGVTWFYLQYVVGLADLGHEVFYIEDSGEWPYNEDGGASGNDWVARDPTPNVSYLAEVMARFGFADRWAYRFPLESRWFGMSPTRVQEVLESADLLINISGTLEYAEEYRKVRRLAYIDTDPVFTQLRFVRGLEPEFCRQMNTHDIHFSYAECLSSEFVPPTGHRWLPTRAPIVLSEWPPSSLPARDVFTTIMNWTSYNAETYAGKTYGQKDVEFQQFLDLPSLVAPAVLELAIGVGKNNPTPYEMLRSKGWQLVDPLDVCYDLDSMRTYTASSKAEWSIAKHGYVEGRSGWFSERSARYLAAGRPVVVQDTGFSKVIPVGEGIFAFNSVDEAVAGIREVGSNYERHAKAAREIAEEYFDAEKVLRRLIDEAGAASVVDLHGASHPVCDD